MIRKDGTVGWQGGKHLAETAVFTGAFCEALLKCWLDRHGLQVPVQQPDFCCIMPWKELHRTLTKKDKIRPELCCVSSDEDEDLGSPLAAKRVISIISDDEEDPVHEDENL